MCTVLFLRHIVNNKKIKVKEFKSSTKIEALAQELARIKNTGNSANSKSIVRRDLKSELFSFLSLR